MINIHDLCYEDLLNQIRDMGEPEFRTRQILRGLYEQTYTNWDEFTALSKALRHTLSNLFSISSFEPVDQVSSFDRLTEKFLFRLPDNHHIETVLLKKGSRLTLCVSTQVGCPVGCVFCATGKIPFARNLTSGEIIEQILFFTRLLRKNDERVTNIVLMGMGEPLLNFSNSCSAIKKIIDLNSLNFGARRITVSTIGIIPEMEKLSKEKLQINLAVSLHSPSQELRNDLIPVGKNYPLDDLISACRNYFDLTGRRITFEYVMIRGVNDSLQHANKLSNLLAGLTCHVNLIPLNPIPLYEGVAPEMQTMREFGRILLNNRIPVSLRDSQGSDIQAGCGQLAGKKQTDN